MVSLAKAPRRHARRSTDISLTALGDQVRAARTRANLSQQDLALASGVGRTTILKLENGHQGVSIGAAQRVLNALRLALTAVPK